MSLVATDEIEARARLVDEHIRCENNHDLEALMATFGSDARYDDEPWRDYRVGLEAVRSYYTELMSALPDLSIEVTRRHLATDSLIVEVRIRGTHLGPWRGLPVTGSALDFPLCGVYEFDRDNLLAAERIYYDRGLVLRQLGLFSEPVRGWGRLLTVLGHPVTIARAYLRRDG